MVAHAAALRGLPTGHCRDRGGERRKGHTNVNVGLLRVASCICLLVERRLDLMLMVMLLNNNIVVDDIA